MSVSSGVLKLSIVVLSLGVAGTALADKKAMKKADKALAAATESASDTCKTPITAKIDWASFKGKFDKKKYFGVDTVGDKCGEAVNTIRSYCGRSERHQKGVAESFASMTCKHDSDSDVTWKLKKKAAVVGYGSYQVDIDDLRTEYFEYAFLSNGGPAEEAYYNKKLQEEAVAPANEACGKKLKINIDWTKFRGTYKLERQSGKTPMDVYGAWSSMVNNIRDWCGSTGKEKRAKRIKAGLTGMTCTWDKNATRKKLKRPGATHKFKKKHLISGWTFKTEVPETHINDFFLKHFKIDESGAMNARKTMDKQRIQAYRRCKKKHTTRWCSKKHRVNE